ncbi:Fungalysin metallopeptidase-domain-containing protein [Amylostereum chailletii]|nr:Fungalysin metallopeptidase-domain-containing protein [Amylostereum chailletii]
MARFAQLLSSVLVALAFASSATAAPWPTSSKHATHRVRAVGPGASLEIESFHPASSFETFGTDGLDHPLAKRDGFDLTSATTAFVASKLGIDSDAVSFTSGFAGEASKHAYVKQQINGLRVANAVANVAFNNDGKVASFGSSFVKPDSIADSTPSISKEEAISTAETTLDGKYNEHPTRVEYLVKDDNTAVLVHVIQIQNETTHTWYEAFVDAHNNKVISVNDFVNKATYRVLPIREEVITQGFQNVANPEDATASPNGWITGTTTSGNNVVAAIGSKGASQSSSGSFIYTQNANAAPTTTANKNAAIVNAFYVANSVHDISYLYGFTESAFNFQKDNFGKGGKGSDPVTISVQDSAGTDNADFSTPPDGQSGAMRMFLWDETSPERDGALENDIVVHENTHGITNRLTGGGTGACLQTTEAGGMGEGWSDAFADWTEQSSGIVDYIMGQYVVNDPAGIRSHPYSRSSTTNPLTYASVGTLNEVHNIGEVWANTLHNVLGALVDAHGFDANALTDPSSTAGNAVFLHIFIDALALQPCNPTFLTARDSWIQADANRYKGANKCTLWKAFASRGLGTKAANHKDDKTLPSGC